MRVDRLTEIGLWMRFNLLMRLRRARPSAVKVAGLAWGLAVSVTACATSAMPSTAPGVTPGISVARTTTWRTYRIPAPAATTDSSFTAISCRTATSCVAGGTAYTSTQSSPEAFTVSYASGRWAPAKTMIMPAGTESSQLNGLACVPVGGCVAVGTYTTSAGPSYSFIATQSRARWAVTRLRLPSSDITASLNGITCPAPGDCVAVGSIDTPRYGEMPMVVTEANGRWQQPSEIMPPAKPTPRYGGDQLLSVACQRAGDCVAVGVYNVAASPSELVTRPMITTESDGRWLPARGIQAPADTARINDAPGIGVLEAAGLRSVSCAWHGPCLAAGLYLATPSRLRELAVIELHGQWSPTQELIPARGATAACNDAFCLIAGGGPTLISPGTAVSYARGQWGPAVLIRPPADASQSPVRGYEIQIGGVACFLSGRCIAVGSYIDKSVHRVLLVATRS